MHLSYSSLLLFQWIKSFFSLRCFFLQLICVLLFILKKLVTLLKNKKTKTFLSIFCFTFPRNEVIFWNFKSILYIYIYMGFFSFSIYFLYISLLLKYLKCFFIFSKFDPWIGKWGIFNFGVLNRKGFVSLMFFNLTMSSYLW